MMIPILMVRTTYQSDYAPALSESSSSDSDADEVVARIVQPVTVVEESGEEMEVEGKGDDETFLDTFLRPWTNSFAHFPVLSDFVPDDQCGLHIDHMQSHAPLISLLKFSMTIFWTLLCNKPISMHAILSLRYSPKAMSCLQSSCKPSPWCKAEEVIFAVC